MSTICTQGVVRDGRVELERGIDLPDGTEVSVTVHPKLSREEWERRIRALAARGPLDPTYVQAVEDAVRERKLYLPREIDLDAAP